MAHENGMMSVIQHKVNNYVFSSYRGTDFFYITRFPSP